jgi:hypothetical protein
MKKTFISAKNEIKAGQGRPWLSALIALWAFSTALSAFLIPTFDYGFDGIKIWFYLSILMLLGYSLLFTLLRRSSTKD